MVDLPVLSAVDQRVLGSLLEKERTVPASYPMTLNALRTACNQTSSRDPVTAYDDDLVEQACRSLKDRGLVRIVWADRGPRTLKYHQLLSERLALAEDERALLTVLLLRGQQAAGELRTRTDRLHPFPDRRDVEDTLERMAAAPVPLVRVLPRRAGERDPRWVHLLGDPAAAHGAQPAEPPALVVDLATRDERVRSAYDRMAAAHAAASADELDHHPFERWLLDRVVRLAGASPVIEVGSGPGHVTAYLADRGARASGLDVAPAMVEQARARYPQASFEVGDLRRLMRPAGADGWGAVLAWYSLVHSVPEELPDVVRALIRPLRPGGWLVYAGCAGTGSVHREEAYGERVDVDIVRHDPSGVAAVFTEAGLVDVEWYARGAAAGPRDLAERGYVLGRLPT